MLSPCNTSKMTLTVFKIKILEYKKNLYVKLHSTCQYVKNMALKCMNTNIFQRSRYFYSPPQSKLCSVYITITFWNDTVMHRLLLPLRPSGAGASSWDQVQEPGLDLDLTASAQLPPSPADADSLHAPSLLVLHLHRCLKFCFCALPVTPSIAGSPQPSKRQI